jgi:FkbM family methyltransferase
MFEDIFINRCYYFATKEKQPFIIDCGCNIGMALIFFKKVYPNSRIIAFEPDKKTFEILNNNVEINNLKNVKLLNKAVYNFEGNINFYYDPDQPGLMIMSLIKERLPKTCEKVDSVLLSDHIKGKIDFLKMDIEGVEDIVIEELIHRNKLKFVEEMIIEYHHHINPKRDNISKTLKILEENGFGYQISTTLKTPFNKGRFQDILIYAYKKSKYKH